MIGWLLRKIGPIDTGLPELVELVSANQLVKEVAP